MAFVTCLRKYFYPKFINNIIFLLPSWSLKYPTEKKCYYFIVLFAHSSSKHLVMNFSLSLSLFLFLSGPEADCVNF